MAVWYAGVCVLCIMQARAILQCLWLPSARRLYYRGHGESTPARGDAVWAHSEPQLRPARDV